MPFRFTWYDDDKTVMQLIAEGDWNWRDYHAAARACTFSMMNERPDNVTILLDLRGSTRDQMPAGLRAHSTSFGKKLTPALNGSAVVLGMPLAAWHGLPLNEDGTLSTVDGRVYYAEDEAKAQDILQQIRENNA
ncbi:MAG: hypothetical protein KC496_04475 [Anaerolineae bacterium]|nr:hypothetical protein [Anaerolineae bacterium]